MKRFTFTILMTLSVLHSAILRGNWLIAAPYDQHYAEMAHHFLNNTLTVDAEVMAENRKLVQPFAIAEGAVLKADDTWDDGMDAFLDTAPKGSVAIIQIKSATMKEDFCGWPGTNTIGRWIQKSDNHKNTTGQVILMDTPGGSADGPAQLNDIIKNTKKPTAVWIDGLMASAGVFIGCSADHIMANTPAAMIGSIGTQSTLRDYTQRLNDLGVKEITVTSDLSPNKNKAYFDALKGDQQPLKDEMLNPLTKVFHSYVVANRGSKMPNKESAKAPLDGRMYLAQDALKYGLIDSIGTLQDAVNWVKSYAPIKSSIVKVV